MLKLAANPKSFHVSIVWLSIFVTTEVYQQQPGSPQIDGHRLLPRHTSEHGLLLFAFIFYDMSIKNLNFLRLYIAVLLKKNFKQLFRIYTVYVQNLVKSLLYNDNKLIYSES